MAFLFVGYFHDVKPSIFKKSFKLAMKTMHHAAGRMCWLGQLFCAPRELGKEAEPRAVPLSPWLSSRKPRDNPGRC